MSFFSTRKAWGKCLGGFRGSSLFRVPLLYTFGWDIILTKRFGLKQNVRSIQKQPFADAFQNGVPENFATFTGKYKCWNLTHKPSGQQLH